MSAINTVLVPPSRSMAPAAFINAADQFAADLVTWTGEANTLAAGLSNASTNSVSSTSLSIGTGSKSLTVETAKGYVPGTLVIIAETATPANWMHGEVTTYNAGTGALVVSVERVQGSGTAAAWTVSLSGPVANVLPVGGAEPSQAVDLTLTSTSARVQSVTMTAASKSVILPDPLTLEEGGPVFMIHKFGGYGFDIKTNAGGLVGRLNTSRWALCMLIDAATDTWRVAYAETSFAVGASATINAATTNGVRIVALDSTHALMLYLDGGDGDKGKAVVLTISGTTITAGTPATFNSGSTGFDTPAALSSTAVIVPYLASTNGTAVVLSISGTTITVGTPATFATANNDDMAICALSSTLAVVAYRDGAAANIGKARCLSISGTTITTPTAAATFEAGAMDFVSIDDLDATHAAIAYQDTGNSSYGTVCIISVSGTTITAGTPVVFASASSSETDIAATSASSAVVVYYDGSAVAKACAMSISGTVPTPGTAVTVYTGVNRTRIAAVDADTVEVLIQDSTTAYSRLIELDVIGTTVSEAIPATTLKVGSTSVNDLCLLSTQRAVVVARDNAASSYGIAIAVGL